MLLFCFRTRKPRTCFDTLIFPIAVTVTTKKCNISIRKLHRINFQAVGTFLWFPLLLLIRQWFIFVLIVNICFKFVFVLFCCCFFGLNRGPSVFKTVELFDVYYFYVNKFNHKNRPIMPRALFNITCSISDGKKCCGFFLYFYFAECFFSLSLRRFFSHVTSSLHLNENWTILCTMHTHIHYRRNIFVFNEKNKRKRKERKKKQYSKPNISIFRQSLNKINPRVRSLMACFYLQPLAVRIWYEWNALHRWCFVQIKLKLKYLLGKRNELKFGKIKSSFGNKHRHFLK